MQRDFHLASDFFVAADLLGHALFISTRLVQPGVYAPYRSVGELAIWSLSPQGTRCLGEEFTINQPVSPAPGTARNQPVPPC